MIGRSLSALNYDERQELHVRNGRCHGRLGRQVEWFFGPSHNAAHTVSQLRREMPSVSERVLTQQLRQLEADGVIDREVFPQVPPTVVS